MAYSRRDLNGSFRGHLDLFAPGNPAKADKEPVRAYSSSRDGQSIDPRRDPAYHNRVLFDGSRH